MEIKVNVPNGKSGLWAVESFTITNDQAKMYNIRASYELGRRLVEPRSYKKLTYKNHVVMSNTPAEINDHTEFIHKAQSVGGHILINGLGLGVALTAILTSKKITQVTIVEISQDVIKLVAPSFQNDFRVTIIHVDAFEYKPPKEIKYTCVWHDIWSDINTDNLIEMTKLHRKYGCKTDWQDSWAKDTHKLIKRMNDNIY